MNWEPLIPGDIIDIIAPGYPVKPEVLSLVKKKIKKHGYTPRVSPYLLAPQFFHSNSDQVRLSQLKAALVAKDSKAVWCLRGGYGSNRLIPGLGKIKKMYKPKIFIGISDITSLHVFLNQKWQWPTLHGALLDRVVESSQEEIWLNELFDILVGQKKEVLFSDLRPMNNKARRLRKKEAMIVGGNLTTLQSALGTPFEVQTKGRFLFLEDIGERGYRIDRMLVHLKQAGCLKDCEGVLFGHFVGGDEPANSEKAVLNRVEEALVRFAMENPSLPIWNGVESGHGKFLRTLPLGTSAMMVRDNHSKTSHFCLHIKTGCR